jgi:hypothetical protein
MQTVLLLDVVVAMTIAKNALVATNTAAWEFLKQALAGVIENDRWSLC